VSLLQRSSITIDLNVLLQNYAINFASILQQLECAVASKLFERFVVIVSQH